MVNYKQIVDAIPPAQLSTAIAALTPDFRFMDIETVKPCLASVEALTVTNSRGNAKYSYQLFSAQIGMADTSKLEKSVISAIAADDLPQWVNKTLNGVGININDPQINGALQILLGHGGDQDMIDAILAEQNVTTKEFPQIKLGHVQNAIQKRAAGEI